MSQIKRGINPTSSGRVLQLILTIEGIRISGYNQLFLDLCARELDVINVERSWIGTAGKRNKFPFRKIDPRHSG
jgi:hypothetical protein